MNMLVVEANFMTLTTAQETLLARYLDTEDVYLAMAAPFAADAEAVKDSWTTILEELIPTLPYVDQPDHPMANSAFECAGALAVYLALQRVGGGVNAHEFGPVMIEGLGNGPAGSEPSHSYSEFVAAGVDSQATGSAHEFVFNMSRGDGAIRSIDITSCAICHMCAPHAAMDLVPYMCSLDDAVSDRFSQGLRRTGTIALGANHCDFRFTGRDGTPLDLAQQYPDRIRLNEG